MNSGTVHSKSCFPLLPVCHEFTLLNCQISSKDISLVLSRLPRDLHPRFGSQKINVVLYALQFSPSFLRFSGDSWSLVYSANFYENMMLVPAHLKPQNDEWDSHTLTSSNSVTTVLTWIIFNFESTSMDSTGVVWSRWHFSAMLSMAILMQPSISLCQEMTNNIWFSTGGQWWHYNYSPQQPFLVLSCTLSSSGKDRH